MARRYIGDAVIEIFYRDRGDYAGRVTAHKKTWHFEDLYAAAIGFGPGIAYDSPAAYDEMAQSAVSFGSYYTIDNRGPEFEEQAACNNCGSPSTAWKDVQDVDVRDQTGHRVAKAFVCENCGHAHIAKRNPDLVGYPDAATADAIAEAVNCVLRDDGTYEVKRSRK